MIGHHEFVKGCAVSTLEIYETPLGPIKINNKRTYFYLFTLYFKII